ncbi:MAG: mandelate racemase/muconate lactonizing enzyme family protein [Alicyclobacillus sp.]|nr:mandelate racemase/muconate lactonizing enzyme family protein [Alicyclobacillus sp.]
MTMRISDIEVYHLRLDVVEERCDGTQDTLIVRVSTDDGYSGIGEVDSSPEVARAAVDARFSHTLANGLRNLLLGEDPFDVERIWHKMYAGTLYFGRSGPALHAMSGIDIALWDIIGKACGRPVCRMLGGAFREQILAYASALMPDTAAEAARMAESFAVQGYRAMKFGWGTLGRSERDDIERIRAIRSVLSPDVKLMIDAGHAYDRRTAIRMAHHLAELGVHWLEEPLPPHDLRGYRDLAAAQPGLYIAAGEQAAGRREFQAWMDEADIDIVQPDLARCGGFTEARKIAYMALDRNRLVAPHAFKTGILLSASVHFAASIPNGHMVEYTQSASPLARALVHTDLQFHDGYLRVPQTPGLGVELDDSVVQRYLVRAQA